MPKYKVIAKEIWLQEYTVEANTEEEARRLVDEGEGSAVENSFNFYELYGEESWIVEPYEE